MTQSKRRLVVLERCIAGLRQEQSMQEQREHPPYISDQEAIVI
jgi:hypothetical protein